jgi:hypothetical protein
MPAFAGRTHIGTYLASVSALAQIDEEYARAISGEQRITLAERLAPEGVETELIKSLIVEIGRKAQREH